MRRSSKRISPCLPSASAMPHAKSTTTLVRIAVAVIRVHVRDADLGEERSCGGKDCGKQGPSNPGHEHHGRRINVGSLH